MGFINSNMELELKYLQKSIDYLSKLIGLLVLIVLFPLFAYIIVQNVFITGLLVGIMLFASISLFNIELRTWDLPKFSKIKKKKFINSIFVSPMIIGVISSYFNITLDYENFIFIDNWIKEQITFVPNIENQILIDYIELILKVIPSAIATVYFIKLFIFHLFTLGLFL